MMHVTEPSQTIVHHLIFNWCHFSSDFQFNDIFCCKTIDATTCGHYCNKVLKPFLKV
ncbi:hypothetical protein LOK49_LG02G01836 [Camellia lanceoleosa]|uniref:Uncharacterized protein n=1 Tax=Camellia lanceoleosa TaxID=1840588 RepID=A0ACC0IN55_9ERIC|nr:hypothetical protein LOK49_LG02G01836 [Camellia lanceoleosa]